MLERSKQSNYHRIVKVFATGKQIMSNVSGSTAWGIVSCHAIILLEQSALWWWFSGMSKKEKSRKRWHELHKCFRSHQNIPSQLKKRTTNTFMLDRFWFIILKACDKWCHLVNKCSSLNLLHLTNVWKFIRFKF